MKKVTSWKALGGLLFAGMLALASCKEKGPAITLLEGGKIVDTSFTSGVETPQQKRILIEEATGVKCSNCPTGVQKIEDIESQYPDRVIPVGVHAGSLTTPFSFSTYDFRFSEAEDLMNSYFSEGPNKPSISIDRSPQSNGKYFIDQITQWPGAAATRLGLPVIANVTVTSNYSASSNQAVIKVHVAFVLPVSKKLSLSLYLTESGMVDPQEDGINIDSFYVHKNVLRDIITPISGRPFLDNMATKDAGRVYEATLAYTPNAFWKPENCKVVAFVHTNEPGDKNVLQVAEVNLK